MLIIIVMMSCVYRPGYRDDLLTYLLTYSLSVGGGGTAESVRRRRRQLRDQRSHRQPYQGVYLRFCDASVTPVLLRQVVSLVCLSVCPSVCLSVRHVEVS